MKLLLLGETAEALALAQRVSGGRVISREGRRIELLAAVDAGRARRLGEVRPCDFPPDRRRGGVKGAEGLVTAIKWERARALVDASHPFDLETRRAAAEASRALGLPLLQLHRPLWPVDGPRLSRRGGVAEAARKAPFYARLFLWVGHERLGPFAERLELWTLTRAFQPPGARYPLARGDFAYGQGPFTTAHEKTLLSDYRISRLVMENAGGALGTPTLEAAAALDLPVDLIDPPEPPRPGPLGTRVDGVAAALEALGRLR